MRSVPNDQSRAFRELRDAILALEQDDRRQLAALAGAMHAPQPPISAPLAEILGVISRHDVTDRRRLARWCAQYVSRSGCAIARDLCNWRRGPASADRIRAPAGGVSARTRVVVPARPRVVYPQPAGGVPAARGWCTRAPAGGCIRAHAGGALARTRVLVHVRTW